MHINRGLKAHDVLVMHKQNVKQDSELLYMRAPLKAAHMCCSCQYSAEEKVPEFHIMLIIDHASH